MSSDPDQQSEAVRIARKAGRLFRSVESQEAEDAARSAVPQLLAEHGFTSISEERRKWGSAQSQYVTAHDPSGRPIKAHVRICWRRDGRTPAEKKYSAAQLRASLINGDWEGTLAYIAQREKDAGATHNLLVQVEDGNFVLAALIPSEQIPLIWQRQREVSDELLARGVAGRARRNHAENGKSPTLWLQEDRTPETHAIADVLWNWPGVVDVLRSSETEASTDDALDDLLMDPALFGRDAAERLGQVKSGYPRDPKVRAAVIERAKGECERSSCGERRAFRGFLDVHHILGVAGSDRIWSCVALCPNCHREAHFHPEKDAINSALLEYASQFSR